MTSEPQNKLLARRFLEEVVNTDAVDRLSDFLAPEYVAPILGIAGIDQAREHMLMFRRCYPDMVVIVEGQVAERGHRCNLVRHAGHAPGSLRPCACHGEKDYVASGQRSERDGRIVEHWGGSNSLETLLELGVVRWASDVGAVDPTAQPGASPKGGT